MQKIHRETEKVQIYGLEGSWPYKSRICKTQFIIVLKISTDWLFELYGVDYFTGEIDNDASTNWKSGLSLCMLRCESQEPKIINWNQNNCVMVLNEIIIGTWF